MPGAGKHTSIVCLVVVVAASTPVLILRTKTYTLGYEIAQLKSQEQLLRIEIEKLEEQKLNLKQKWAAQTTMFMTKTSVSEKEKKK
jgi:hypothetical protein